VRPGGSEYALLSLSINGGIREERRLLNDDYGCLIPHYLVGREMEIRLSVASSKRKKITVHTHIWSSAGRVDLTTGVEPVWVLLCEPATGTEALLQEGRFNAYTGALL
jgi:hypothetical protein